MADRTLTGMTLRRVAEHDLDALLPVWNTAARHDPLGPALAREKIWGDPDFEPDLAVLAEVAGRPAGFVLGVLRANGGAPRGFVKLLAVDPALRRRGLGSRLLIAVESGLVARGARTVRIGEGAPNYLAPGVDTRYRSAPPFLARRGYRPVGEACNMTVDLGGRDFDSRTAERTLAAEGIVLRRAQKSDRAGVTRLLEAHWPAWLPEVRTALGNRPVTLHLALRDGDVLAFAAHDANNRGSGWFGPMGTAPAARGLGLGRALLMRCLADMAAQGHRRATIPWVEPVAFYRETVGAMVDRTFHRYEKEFSP